MKMKKVGALAVAAALVTMSGVYAAWTYSESSAGAATKNLTVGLAEATTDSAYGKLSVLAVDKIFSVDQADAEYNAKMIYQPISFTFTPNAGASESVTTNGIAVRVSFRLNNAGLYDGKEILSLNPTHEDVTTTVNNTTNTYDYFSFIINPVGTTTNTVTDNVDFGSGTVKTWEAQEDGSFKFTVSAENLAEYISLNPVKLETHEKYDAFSVELNKSQIQVRVADLTDTSVQVS